MNEHKRSLKIWTCRHVVSYSWTSLGSPGRLWTRESKRSTYTKTASETIIWHYQPLPLLQTSRLLLSFHMGSNPDNYITIDPPVLSNCSLPYNKLQLSVGRSLMGGKAPRNGYRDRQAKFSRPTVFMTIAACALIPSHSSVAWLAAIPKPVSFISQATNKWPLDTLLARNQWLTFSNIFFIVKSTLVHRPQIHAYFLAVILLKVCTHNCRSPNRSGLIVLPTVLKIVTQTKILLQNHSCNFIVITYRGLKGTYTIISLKCGNNGVGGSRMAHVKRERYTSVLRQLVVNIQPSSFWLPTH